MAAVTQTITPTPTVQLFSGIPVGTNNIYPRARVIFQDATAITAKIATNTNTVAYELVLPPNYAYRFDQASISFGLSNSLDADNFENLGLVFLKLVAGTNTVAMNMKSEGVTNSVTIAGRNIIWNLENPFQEVFRQSGPGSVALTVMVFDNDGTENTDALTSLSYFSFLQYDINQILDVSVNAPLPVSIV